MTLSTTTHVNFRRDARAALEFYRSVFAGELVITTYGDMHAAQGPEDTDLAMWGQVTSADGFRVMAYDVPAAREYDKGIDPFFESVRAQTAQEAAAVWEKLADGAIIKAPFGATPWTAGYGMLTDKFGVTWVVDVEVSGP